MIENIINFIKKNEGTGPIFNDRFFPYNCPSGKLTIAYGRNIQDVGIRKKEADFMLHNDINDCLRFLKKTFHQFDSFSSKRQMALTDMVYNLGQTGFLTFKKMIKAIHLGDWKEAAIQAKDSDWFDQVKTRGKIIVRIIDPNIEI